MSAEIRDGFVIREYDGTEVSFVKCEYNHDRMRERVLMGLLRNLRDGLVVVDTRDEPGDES